MDAEGRQGDPDGRREPEGADSSTCAAFQAARERGWSWEARREGFLEARRGWWDRVGGGRSGLLPRADCHRFLGVGDRQRRQASPLLASPPRAGRREHGARLLPHLPRLLEAHRRRPRRPSCRLTAPGRPAKVGHRRCDEGSRLGSVPYTRTSTPPERSRHGPARPGLPPDAGLCRGAIVRRPVSRRTGRAEGTMVGT